MNWCSRGYCGGYDLPEWRWFAAVALAERRTALRKAPTSSAPRGQAAIDGAQQADDRATTTPRGGVNKSARTKP